MPKPTSPLTTEVIEPGSFRDPDSRVFYSENRVLRGLSARAATDDERLRQSGLMTQLVHRHLVLDNWRVEGVNAPPSVPDAAIVESRRLAAITYPFEWSFSMLQDAALLLLDINLHALESGFVLKDASAYNIAFDGSRPLLLDVSSFEPFARTGIWTAYGQFCDQFLAPLLLEAHTGVAFQPYLRDRPEGFPITDLNALLRGRARWRRGVLTHVRLRARLERRGSGLGTADRRVLREAELSKETVAATMTKMRRLIERLRSRLDSTWIHYEVMNPYKPEHLELKRQFVDRAAGNAAVADRAWDIGANTGEYSAILAKHFGQVLAIDSDPAVVDELYRKARRGDGCDGVTPVVADVANPTPDFGWRLRERTTLRSRAPADFALWLAVVHHLCLGQGIPLSEVITLIAELSPECVVEFISPDDPMAARITATRRDSAVPYSQSIFEDLVGAHFEVVDNSEITPTRTLYHLRRSPGRP